MIGALPRYDQAPLDYRYALDAAMVWLAAGPRVAVACRVPALVAEVRQRLPNLSEEGAAQAGLWVEPLADTWQADLAHLAGRLPPDAPLVIVTSQPLARIIPERRPWPGAPLGLQAGGLGTLRRALARAGFVVEQRHGVHSVNAIALNQLGQVLGRLGRPDLRDRLEFAARLRYRVGPPWTALATVGLWIARRELRLKIED